MVNNNYSEEIIFIGGVHRSGTNILRSLLNQNFESVNCTRSSTVFSGLLWQYFNTERQSKEQFRLEDAGVPESLQKTALQSALLGTELIQSGCMYNKAR